MIDMRLGTLRKAWNELTGSARVKLTGVLRPDLPEDDCERLRAQIDACLEGRGGEVSARARAADLGRTYLALNATGQHRFLAVLAQDYGVDREAVSTAMDAVYTVYRDGGDELAASRALRRAEQALREALSAPRVRLLAQFNGLPEGVKFLVDMRADLISFRRQDAGLAALDVDLRRLLASWFDVGFLELRCITWDAPASLLEKLALYEAVHPVRSWEDLKHRLAPDRRCYAFFHPQMPDEPLIYVWVALVRGISDNVQEILDVKVDPQDPNEMDTAIFYSISNAQEGLAGVSFGNFLIKRVVADLSKDFRRLKTFATLSPIPGFMKWLRTGIERGSIALQAAEERALTLALPELAGIEGLLSAVSDRSWYRRETAQEALQTPLRRLCARYLTEVREDGRVLDRVAHFHLSNGARIERINWLADRSTRGLEQSAGMMVNYCYKSGDIEANHEAYTGEGKICISGKVKDLLKG